MLSDDALPDSIKQVHCWHNLCFKEWEPLSRGDTGSSFSLFSSCCSAYKGLFPVVFYSVTRSIGSRCSCSVSAVERCAADVTPCCSQAVQSCLILRSGLWAQRDQGNVQSCSSQVLLSDPLPGCGDACVATGPSLPSAIWIPSGVCVILMLF